MLGRVVSFGLRPKSFAESGRERVIEVSERADFDGDKDEADAASEKRHQKESAKREARFRLEPDFTWQGRV